MTSVRKSLGAPPNRTHRDGSPFYTLPIIKDHSTGEVVGDSYEIAQYLEKTYPGGPSLFPSSSTIDREGRAFNTEVDAIFTNHVIICLHGIPFNPETAEISHKEFVFRTGTDSWEDLKVSGDKRVEILNALETALGDLATAYGQKQDGPFLEGSVPSYADLIVGGWLKFYEATVSADEWQAIQSWHGGVWKTLYQALEQYAAVQ